MAIGPSQQSIRPPQRLDRYRRFALAAWLLLIAVAAAGTYLHTLHNDFVFDDRIIVVINGREWQKETICETLWTVLKHDYWGEQRIDSLYRPITSISHVLNYRLSGEHPETFRIVNIALHVACCWVLFGLTCALFDDRRLAGIASLLFAVHALHVEAVAQIVGRAELFAALWTMLALWLYLTDARKRKGRPTWRFPFVLVLFAAALFSKESGVCFIGLAVFYDLWSMRFGPGGRDPRGGTGPSTASHLEETGSQPISRATPPSGGGRTHARRAFSTAIKRLALQRWVALLLVVLMVVTVRFQILGKVTRPSSSIPKLDNPVAQAPLSGRVLTPLVLLGKYVSLLIWPHPMSCDYSYNALPICESPLEPRALWGFACLAGLVTAGFCSYRGRGRALWCVGFFGISYLLVSNTVVLIGTIFAERLMYLPSVAFCWLVAIGAVAAVDWLGERIGGGRRGWFLGALPIVALCALHLSLALARGRVWQSERKLMAAALALTDESARVHTQAGAYGLNDHDPNIAIHHLRRAVEILPDHAIGHYQLGRAYLMAKQPDRAIPHLKRAYGKLAVEANVKPAYYLGQAYMELNTPGLAVPWFELADKYEPNQPSILWAWAQAALGAGNREQAIAVLRRGVQVIPASHQLHDRFRQQLKALMQEDTRPAKPGS